MITLDVPDMNCAHCKARVEQVVAALDGSATVGVDLDTHRLEVGGAVPLDALLAALQRAGYPATVA